MSDDIADDGRDDNDDGEADWLTDALHRAVRSGDVLDYSFCRREGTDEWLLLRWQAGSNDPEVIAVYRSDEDLYQLSRQAEQAVEADIDRRKAPKGYDGSPSVYRHGVTAGEKT